MDLMMIADKSSDVYCNWTEFIDTVIHQSPKFVQHDEQDVFIAINFEYLNVLLESVRYMVEVAYDQEVDEYIATMDRFWFVEAGKTEKEAIHQLAEQLVDYAQDYFKELNMHFHAPNLKRQFPQIIKALVTTDTEEIKQSFDVKQT